MSYTSSPRGCPAAAAGLDRFGRRTADAPPGQATGGVRTLSLSHRAAYAACMATDDLKWKPRYEPLDNLLLDPHNPRFSEREQLDSLSQDDLCLLIDKHYDALQIARSIAKHGYFASEPLIAIKDDSGERYIVVEGNRRLAALKGLASPSLRERLIAQTKAWETLTLDVDLPSTIPVVVVDDRQSVVPLIGFRHISGIEPWEPIAQARFIASLADDGKSLEDIAELVGRSLTEVRSMFRDYEVLRQAKEQFRLNTKRVEGNFGVFNAAMGRTKLRDYIGAPAPRDVSPDYWPLPDDSGPKVERLFTYIFGKNNGEGRVIQDSRQLSALGDILADPSGRAETVLVETKDVDAALQFMRGSRQQLQTYIRSAEQAINSALSLQVTSIDGATRERLKAIKEASEQLLDLPSPE